jgi:leucyl-tRNA synthetase
MVNSGQFDGLAGEEALEAVSAYASSKGFGRKKVNYKLKDWSISRQRYWGCPIPIIHCPKCGEQAVPDADLPVILPKVEKFQPKGRSPLADVPEYMNVRCPACGGPAERDPDTMDTFVCSSWYFLRYLDAQNASEPYRKATADSWMPIDLYIGGVTHATGHLIYFRFFTKFLKDIGWLKCEEPATRLFNHGMVLDESGEVMSKSKGNVVSPITLMEMHGVDVTRLAMYFTKPSEKEVAWSNDVIVGPEKFVLNKMYPLVKQLRGSHPDLKRYFKVESLTEFERGLYIKLNQTIKRANDDYERLQFNTVIAGIMELLRDYDPEQVKNDELNDQLILKSIQLLAPLAPHLAEELWELAGYQDSIFKSSWPEHDSAAVQGDTIEIAVQVNGKLRDSVLVAAGADQAAVEKVAEQSAKVAAFTKGKQVIKKVYVAGRLLNIVVKG